MSTFDGGMKKKAENFTEALVYPSDLMAVHSINTIMVQAYRYINELLAKPTTAKELKGIEICNYDKCGDIVGFRYPGSKQVNVLLGTILIIGRAEAYASTKHTLLERIITILMAELAHNVKRDIDEENED